MSRGRVVQGLVPSFQVFREIALVFAETPNLSRDPPFYVISRRNCLHFIRLSLRLGQASRPAIKMTLRWKDLAGPFRLDPFRLNSSNHV